MTHQRPDSVHVEHGHVHRQYLNAASHTPESGVFRQWWLVWNALLHGLFLVFGSSWCLLHRTSFTMALPGVEPPWLFDVIALALLAFGGWLLLAGTHARISRRTRWITSLVSASFALISWGIALGEDQSGLFPLLASFHAFFAFTWAALLFARRSRTIRKVPLLTHDHVFRSR